MLLNNLIHYEHGYTYEQGNVNDGFFYMFDYDERSYEVNMEFQHQHSFYEICIFLDNAADHIVEGNRYDITFGDIVFIRPFLLHKTQYRKGDAQKRIIIDFSLPAGSSALEAMYAHLLAMFREDTYIYRFEGPEKREIFNRLNDILKLSMGESALKELLIHQKFIDFLGLIYLSRKYNSYHSNSKPDSGTSKIYEIASYIHGNYHEALTLTGLARQFFISKYYLSHQFKTVTGFSLTDYIQITRVRMVQKLLDHTNRHIFDIALSCGFFSFSQFSRVFKKHTGLSPTEYRSRPAHHQNFSV